MAEQWLTYRELGILWNTTPEAARVRCRRANYPRRTNDFGLAEVLVDADAPAQDSHPRSRLPQETSGLPVPYRQPVGTSDDLSLKSLQELEEQVAALSSQLSKAEEQVESMRKLLASEREQVAQLMSALLRRENRRKARPAGLLRRLLFWRRAHDVAGQQG